MFISVQFGYNQSKLFNIGCHTDPLLDAISSECYKDMLKYIKKREEFFQREIGHLKKKDQTLHKRLEKLDPQLAA